MWPNEVPWRFCPLFSQYQILFVVIMFSLDVFRIIFLLKWIFNLFVYQWLFHKDEGIICSLLLFPTPWNNFFSLPIVYDTVTIREDVSYRILSYIQRPTSESVWLGGGKKKGGWGDMTLPPPHQNAKNLDKEQTQKIKIKQIGAK